MKNLLLLMLLLAGAISVASQGVIYNKYLDRQIFICPHEKEASLGGPKKCVYIKCTGVLKRSCPQGYKPIIKGQGIFAECLCERAATKQEVEEERRADCESQYDICTKGNEHACRILKETPCPFDIHVRACNDKNIYNFDNRFCDVIQKKYADAKNREGRTDEQLEKCQSYKKYCGDGNSFFCRHAVKNCDKRSIKELCVKNAIKDEAICHTVTKQLEEFEPKEPTSNTSTSEVKKSSLKGGYGERESKLVIA